MKTAMAATYAAATTNGRALARGRTFLGLLPRVVTDELLGRVVRLVVHDLLRRGLHQVRARALECAGDVVVQRELRQADGVDDDAGRVRRVPHLELELDVEGHVTEGRALHADVGPL